MIVSDWRKYCKRLLLLLLLCLPLAGIAQEEPTEDTEVPAYYKRAVPTPMMEQLKKDKQLQYFDKEEKATKPSGDGVYRFLNWLFYYASALRFIIIGLLLAGLGYLVYNFMKNNGMSIFRKPKLIDGLEDIQEENLHSAAEYEEKIRAAIEAKDIRQAIRWWYLYTLFQLAGKQVITPSREKTNNDYLRSMRNTPYYKMFSTLTLDYEYIWYGGFEVSEDNFREMNRQFREFNNLLGKAS